MVEASQLFDVDYYLRRYPEAGAARADPIVHFLEQGARRGCKPCPFFDTAWYLRTYPDVARSGINPLVHFILIGAAEGRNPGPGFDCAFYLRKFPEVAQEGLNPLSHYLSYGQQEERPHHPLRFSAALRQPLPAVPLPRSVGLAAGSPLAVSGWCFHESATVRGVRLLADDTPFAATHPLPREDLIGSEPGIPADGMCGFYTELVLVEPGRRWLTFEVVLETGETVRLDFGNEVVVTPQPPTAPSLPSQPHQATPPARGRGTREPTVFTLVCKEAFPAGLALREAFLSHHPGCEFLLVCPDLLHEQREITAFARLHGAGVRVLFPPELGNAGLAALVEQLAFRLGAHGLQAALLPFVFAHLLGQGRQRVLYLHSRLCVQGPLPGLLAALDSHEMIVSPSAARPPAGQDGFGDLPGGDRVAFLGMRAAPATGAAIAAWRADVERWAGGEGAVESGAGAAPEVPAFLRERAFPVPDAPLAATAGEGAATLPDEARPVGEAPLAAAASHWDFLPGLTVRIPALFRGAGSAALLARIPRPYRADETVARRLLAYLGEDVFGDGTLTRFAHRFWQATPALQRVRRRLTRPAHRKGLAAWLRGEGARLHDLPEALLQPPGPGAPLPGKPGLAGINAIGYFRNSFGIAQVAKAFVRRMESTGIPLATFSVPSDLHLAAPDAGDTALAALQCEKPLHAVNLFFVNADQIIANNRIPFPHDSVHVRFPYLFADKVNVGVFFWEFEAHFEQFKRVFDHIDHVVVFSDFIAGAVRRAAPARVQVTKLPYPYEPPAVPRGSRAGTRRRYGLRSGDFVFLFFFDFLSILARKNPHALVEAFARACRGKADARLVLKTLHAEANPEGLQQLLDLIRKLGVEPNVTLIHEGLTQGGMAALMDAADCFASLHRSEGLGLGLLDSMLLGKPVIGTRYGGNLEFMRDDNSLLVDCTMTTVSKSEGPYRRGWKWADPDIGHAAKLMRKLYDDREQARRLGRAGRASVEARFHPDQFKGALLDFCAALPPPRGMVAAPPDERS